MDRTKETRGELPALSIGFNYDPERKRKQQSAPKSARAHHSYVGPVEKPKKREGGKPSNL